MPKKTLLKMTQDILASLDGEEVNSISDTVESMQIVGFIRNSYENIIDSLNLPETFSMFNLDPSLSLASPVVMYLPDNVDSLLWIKYDKHDLLNTDVNYQGVTFMPIEEFLNYSYSYNTTQWTDVSSYTVNQPTGVFTLYCKNNQAPTYYTVLNDKTILFDSYNKAVEDTLMSSKTSCYGQLKQPFLEIDTFIPNLDGNQFTLLENEAKAQAFAEQKQSQNPIAEKRARKGWIRSQRNKIAAPEYMNAKLASMTNFGRRGPGYGLYQLPQHLRNGR